MLCYLLKTNNMLLFTTLIFTIPIISSTIDTPSEDCSDVKCNSKSDATPICLEIQDPESGTFHVPFSNYCLMKDLKCSLGNKVKTAIVDMIICKPPRRKVEKEPVQRVAAFNLVNNNDYDDSTGAEVNNQTFYFPCPDYCPKLNDSMVCGRCSHGIYKTFLTWCHMRMYQCKTNDKMEFVKEGACGGSAPYLIDSNTTIPKPSRNWERLNKKLRIKEHYFEVPTEEIRTPKPTINVTWPIRHHRTTTTAAWTPATTAKREVSTTQTTTTTTTTENSEMKDDELTRIDVDICPGDEDQDTEVDVPDKCSSQNEGRLNNTDFMKVDLHPDLIEDGSPVWMVDSTGQNITSTIRADAGLVVGCVAYAGLDYSGTVVVRTKNDGDFLGFVFGYRNNRQFYVVTWKAKPGKYWRGDPFIVTADAGLHIKLVNSKTGPGAYLRNALYSTKSVKDEVTLLWQDPKKQGWKHLVIYHWHLIHRPQIGLIRVMVSTVQDRKLVVDSGNIYDKTLKGGRIGVYAFSQESIKWLKMDSRCNDKIPSNLMPELPPDLQEISVIDDKHKWINVTLKLTVLHPFLL